jgi:hypothetical protein
MALMPKPRGEADASGLHGAALTDLPGSGMGLRNVRDQMEDPGIVANAGLCGQPVNRR